MSKTKPQPGEWWQRNSNCERVFICGETNYGALLYQYGPDNVVAVAFGSWTGWQHLPDCTGFDWVPEVWPKYYESINSPFAYCRRDAANKYCVIRHDGVIEGPFEWRASDNDRTEITEAEAYSRVKPPESPDDWCDLPADHRMRPELDFYKNGTTQEWVAFTVDNRVLYAGRFNHTRCRRKDLPVPQPKTRRVDVRLVCSTDDVGSIRWIFNDDPGFAGETEVKFDQTGFYVEVPDDPSKVHRHA